MTQPFMKMNGLGNDFVVIDARARRLELPGDVVRAIADRDHGVGCDQLIVIDAGVGGAQAGMRIWNHDGGEVDACGNATRCVAQFLMDESGASRIAIDTNAGRLMCTPAGEGQVTVDMGAPRFEWQDIPIAERMDTRTLDLRLGPIDDPVLFGPSAVNVGNPHCIFFVDDVMAHQLDKVGPMIENHMLFPERTNVSLVEIRSPSSFRQRVWERGVGITRACGTAACASVPAAARRQMADRAVDVELDGGVLHIEWRESSGHIFMTGPTQFDFAGEIPDNLLRAEGVVL